MLKYDYMAKYTLRLLGRKLRQNGKSVKEIAERLHVSKSTVSIWCRDISLTPSQIETLHKQMIRGGYRGRLKGARLQREKKESKIAAYREAGVKKFRSLNEQGILLVGLGLYLGEGSKGDDFQFTNSNPTLVRFVITWLKKCFGVNRNQIVLSVLINRIHKHRERKVRRFWSKVTGIPSVKFNKTILIKSKLKKVYENKNNHFGTLTMRVRKSSELQYKILGLCYGLLKA